MDRKQLLTFRIAFVGTFALCISQSMLINALPGILREFSVGAGAGQLITTSYIFTLGLFSALSAFLVKRFATRSLSLVSFACFLAGCIACVLAPSFPVLLAGRLLQSGGAGISLPLLQNIALAIYPKEQYGHATGVVGIVIGFAPAIGPAIAGPIIDLWGWRMIFMILGGIVAACSLLTLAVGASVGHPTRDEHVNIRSFALFAAGFISLLVAITLLEAGGAAASPSGLTLLTLGVALLMLYVRNDLHAQTPLLHLRCFRIRAFGIDTALVVFGQISMMTASIMVPLFLQGVQHVSATVSGFAIMPGAVLMGLLSTPTGNFYDKHGPRPLAVAGCALLVLGTLAFLPCSAVTPVWLITCLYGLRTVGIACVWSPMVADATYVLPAEEREQATAITTAFRQLLSGMFSTVFIGIMALSTADASGISDHGFEVSFTVLACLSAVMLIASLALVHQTHPQEQQPGK